ncbi:MAG: hypothetical protein M1819_004871 [Sarea resinae]|nr:MAG: hypothetical protein M1819_004871 [Sarea resinae]
MFGLGQRSQAEILEQMSPSILAAKAESMVAQAGFNSSKVAEQIQVIARELLIQERQTQIWRKDFKKGVSDLLFFIQKAEEERPLHLSEQKQLGELEDLYHAACVTILRLINDLDTRSGNYFMDEGFVLHSHGLDGKGAASPVTVKELRTALEIKLAILHDTEFKLEMDEAVKVKTHQKRLLKHYNLVPNYDAENHTAETERVLRESLERRRYPPPTRESSSGLVDCLNKPSWMIATELREKYYPQLEDAALTEAAMMRKKQEERARAFRVKALHKLLGKATSEDVKLIDELGDDIPEFCPPEHECECEEDCICFPLCEHSPHQDCLCKTDPFFSRVALQEYWEKNQQGSEGFKHLFDASSESLAQFQVAALAMRDKVPEIPFGAALESVEEIMREMERDMSRRKERGDSDMVDIPASLLTRSKAQTRLAIETAQKEEVPDYESDYEDEQEEDDGGEWTTSESDEEDDEPETPTVSQFQPSQQSQPLPKLLSSKVYQTPTKPAPVPATGNRDNGRFSIYGKDGAVARYSWYRDPPTPPPSYHTNLKANPNGGANAAHDITSHADYRTGSPTRQSQQRPDSQRRPSFPARFITAGSMEVTSWGHALPPLEGTSTVKKEYLLCPTVYKPPTPHFTLVSDAPTDTASVATQTIAAVQTQNHHSIESQMRVQRGSGSSSSSSTSRSNTSCSANANIKAKPNANPTKSKSVSRYNSWYDGAHLIGDGEDYDDSQDSAESNPRERKSMRTLRFKKSVVGLGKKMFGRRSSSDE